MEKSCRRNGNRTKIYYCHPYSSYERGSNENVNRTIRRWFPKGTDFRKVTAKAIQKVEDWINNYPREILGFRTAEAVFQEGVEMCIRDRNRLVHVFTNTTAAKGYGLGYRFYITKGTQEIEITQATIQMCIRDRYGMAAEP